MDTNEQAQNYTIDGQYLSYQDYKDIGGTLDQSSFNLLEFEARQKIDKYTFGRLKDINTQIQEVKLCVFKLIELEESYNTSEARNKGIASENIDGYSISYTTSSKELNEAKNDEYKEIIKTYLIDCKLEDGTPYLYCGVDK